jgi:hypothetical protein
MGAGNKKHNAVTFLCEASKPGIIAKLGQTERHRGQAADEPFPGQKDSNALREGS